jgi:uncharacterized protein YdhG (YjbR/CyaY superfamily)
MKRKFKTVDDYIKSYPIDIQNRLLEIRKTIKRAAPKSAEVISYQIPAFKLNGMLVWYAAFKNHIGFYPTSKAIKVFSNDLLIYEPSKGTIKFPLDKKIPFSLISRITKYRVKQNLKLIKEKASKG